jgi:hypothetical protein
MLARFSLLSLGVGVTLLGMSSFPVRAVEVNVTNDQKHRWGESQIAINPKDPKNIVFATVGTGFTNDCQAHSPACEMVNADFGVGMPFAQAKGIFTVPDFNVVAAFVSFDHGKTWKRATIPVIPADHPDITGAGDPSVTVTPDGTFYFSFDDNDWGTPEHALPNAGMGVVKSTDGGLTWSLPVLTGTPVDGPKITADPNTGTIYAASSTLLGPHSTGNANSPKGKINDRWLVSSTDGVHWTTPQPIGGFGMVTTAAHGLLATAFKTGGQSMFAAANNELCGSAPAPCVVFQTTKDSGATWSRHLMSIPNLGGSSPFEQPLVAADPSKAGHFAVAMPVDGKEFHVYQTHDAGNTWTAPVVVTDDATKRHYHGAMAYSRQGVLGLMWRTMQPVAGQPAPTSAPAGGPGGGPAFPYNVWAVVSRDGGATFSEPLKVSGADSPAPPAGQFANAGDDYSTIALDGDYVYVGWADWRPVERQNFINALRLDEFKRKH